MHHRLTIICCLLVVSSLAMSDATYRDSGFVDVPGGQVWYQVMGSGDADPLVVLHGGPGGTSCGLQLLSPLGDERAVIRYDQLGSGRSGRPMDMTLWQRDRFVEELDDLRDALGLETIHLLGHSWGGALAAYYYLERPDSGVQSLVLSSPLISTRRWIADANAQRETLPAATQEAMARHEAAGTIDSDEYAEATDQFYAAFVNRGDATEVADCPDAPWNPVIYEHMWGPTEFNATGTLLDFDLEPRLSNVGVPTLFITGEYDEARPSTLRDFAAHIDGAVLEVIPGVAHASLSRAPDRYREIVRAFLEGVEKRRP